ncbi:hypothetical protein BGZ60DRAFT_182731 [Tricladium varicosporioides]|nr:hypothetical protein BGZ60DRAFT_182731 [Hymenoscyphus varicosporioides]
MFPRLIRSSTKKITVKKMSSGVPSETANAQVQSAPTLSDFQNFGIESSDIKTASGVELSQHQKLVVGSVLDLFAGKPSLKKLGLWIDNAIFQDNITKAEGRKQFEPQWYGLQAAFSEIHREHFKVTKGGNPIEMELKTRYKIKGLGKEQTIESLVKIHTTGEGGNMRIKEVVDRWNNDLPEGPFAKAFRHLNAVIVPTLVNVPKNKEEDAKRGS